MDFFLRCACDDRILSSSKHMHKILRILIQQISSMEPLQTTAKRRLLLKIEKLNFRVKQREKRKQILLNNFREFVANNPVTLNNDAIIRAKVKIITGLTNEIETTEDNIEFFYEQLYQILRILHK